MGLGVTDFIALNDVRREIDTAYPNPGQNVKMEPAVGHQSYSHRLVGNAFDYLCRFWLRHQCDEIITPRQSSQRKSYTGWHFPETISYEPGEKPDDLDLDSERVTNVDDSGPRTVVSLTPKPIHRANKQIEQFIQTGMNAEQAVDAALVQAGWNMEQDDGDPTSIDKDAFSNDLVEEIQELFHQFRSQDWTAGNKTYLQPNFGRHSCILEGEADFIIDNLLVDVKTTEDGSFSPSYWRQLFAYYILNDIQRVLCRETERANLDYPELETVGIYFARHGELQTVDMAEVIDDQEEYERFRAWFVDRAIEENHDERINYTDYRAALTDPYDFERQRSLFDY